MTEGCLAVNVIGTHGITCELTTNLSNDNDMQDVPDSDLLLLGNVTSSEKSPYKVVPKHFKVTDVFPMA